MLKTNFIITSLIFLLFFPFKLSSYDFSYKFNNQEFFLILKTVILIKLNLAILIIIKKIMELLNI